MAHSNQRRLGTWLSVVAFFLVSGGCGKEDAKIGSKESHADLQCNTTPQVFTASMVLYSAKHHVNAPKHVVIPNIPGTSDYIDNCSTGFCGAWFRHGRTATVKWKAYCWDPGAEVPNRRCMAKVTVDPNDILVSATNVGGSGYHGHWDPFALWSYSCAFKDLGSFVGTTSCAVDGNEKVIKAEGMTQYGDGVAYGTGYAANHDDSGSPQIGVFVGYGVGGAFINLTPGAGATYRKGGAWAQGMGCDDNGNPYKLPDDGNGHTFPAAGSGDGNE
jgi:hypothetical protein